MSDRKESFVFLLKSALFALMTISVIVLLSLWFRKAPAPSSFPSFSESCASGDKARFPTIVLDAGHGGIDGGAVSVTGKAEKELNLAVTEKLGAFLKAAGLNVVYTRTQDVLLSDPDAKTRKGGDLLARVKAAQAQENALFVSIHMNTLPQKQYRGLQVFYSDHSAVSHALANRLQSDVKALLQPDNHREAKNAQGRIYLLDRITAPSVLIECGFISNEEEARLLEKEDYQNELAFVLSRSLLSAVGEMS